MCVVVGSRGSTPQEKGAKMLVVADGRQLGTLGGGCVEAEVKKRALECIGEHRSHAVSFRLDHDYGWDDGLICGGVMDIHIDVLSGDADAARYEAFAQAIRSGRTFTLAIAYRLDDQKNEKTYREEIGPPPTLLIVGAGHVGQALAELASRMDFRVDVIDDRADVLSAERFPATRRRIVGEIEQELANYPVDENTYVVIVTRGHRHDGRALMAVVDSPAKYVGLIGSISKIKLIMSDLADQGVAHEKLLRVHAPIGLEIGAVTVMEIALSIIAELIAIRRGLEAAGAPMKMSEEHLRAWLTRDKKTPEKPPRTRG